MKWVPSGHPYAKEVMAALDKLDPLDLWDFQTKAKEIVQSLAGPDIIITGVHFRPSFGSGRTISITGKYKEIHSFVVRLWDDDATYSYQFKYETSAGWMA